MHIYIKSQIPLLFAYPLIMGQRMTSEGFVADMFIYLQLSKLRKLHRAKLFYSGLFVTNSFFF